MASEWKNSNLGSIAVLNYGKALTADKRIQGKVPVYSSSGISGWHNTPLVNEEAVIIGRKGTVGTVYYSKEPFYCIDTAYYIKKSDSQADLKFLYYLLQTLGLKNLNEDSAVPGLNRNTAYAQRFRLPDENTQRDIASILSALDDKIELNRQTNETLEEMTKTIFKEWFVNFNYPGATGKMQQSGLGEIPEGWKVAKLGDVLDVKGGTTPSTKVLEYWNGDIHWATPKDLSDLKTPVLLSTERAITPIGLKQISSGLLPVGTLLMSSRAPIGYLAICDIPVAINQGFIAINSQQLSNLFLLYWLKANMAKIISVANGSTFLEISKSVFKELDIAIPDTKNHDTFNDVALPLFEMMVESEREVRALLLIRDNILPKLMKGEIEL